MCKISRKLLVGIAFLGAELSYASNIVEWSPLTAGGTGCPSSSAEIALSPDGNEIVIKPKKYGFELKGVDIEHRFCTVSTYGKVKEGYYLKEIENEFSYSAEKSETSSKITVGISNRFFGENIDPVSQTFADGQSLALTAQTLSEVVSIESKLSAEKFCSGDHSEYGLFPGTIATNASVYSDEGWVAFGQGPVEPVYKIKFIWAPCPKVE